MARSQDVAEGVGFLPMDESEPSFLQDLLHAIALARLDRIEQLDAILREAETWGAALLTSVYERAKTDVNEVSAEIHHTVATLVYHGARVPLKELEKLGYSESFVDALRAFRRPGSPRPQPVS